MCNWWCEGVGVWEKYWRARGTTANKESFRVCYHCHWHSAAMLQWAMGLNLWRWIWVRIGWVCCQHCMSAITRRRWMGPCSVSLIVNPFFTVFLVCWSDAQGSISYSRLRVSPLEPTVLRFLRCMGNESSLLECDRSSFSNYACLTEYRAAIACTSKHACMYMCMYGTRISHATTRRLWWND